MSIVSEIGQVVGEQLQVVNSRLSAIESSSASLSLYTKANAPFNLSDGTMALITDGSVINGPAVAYFYGTCWIRVSDNVTIASESGNLSDCAYG